MFVGYLMIAAAVCSLLFGLLVGRGIKVGQGQPMVPDLTVVTYEQVARWLPDDVVRAIEGSIPIKPVCTSPHGRHLFRQVAWTRGGIANYTWACVYCGRKAETVSELKEAFR